MENDRLPKRALDFKYFQPLKLSRPASSEAVLRQVNSHLRHPYFIVAKFRNFCYSGLVKTHQRIYKIDPITVNQVKIVRVVVDSHYEEKHTDHMSDELILKLVCELDGRRELPETKSGRYSYFATLIELDQKQYRLIWLLEDHAIYIGVVNAYRDKRRK